MAEWSIAAVLKTVDLRGSGGSNPSLSAKKTGNLSAQVYLSKQVFCFAGIGCCQQTNMDYAAISLLLSCYTAILLFLCQRMRMIYRLIYRGGE